jgi:GNAT superfamily N-acetyltransferase
MTTVIDREAALWPGEALQRGGSGPGEALTLEAFGPRDLAELESMVGRCSPQSLYRRFHGVVGSPDRAASLLTGPGQDVYLARRSGRCVGVASVADDGSGSAHIGVLVEDGLQRQGIGTALVCALVGQARRLGVRAVVADVLADDRFVLGVLRGIGPVRTDVSGPGYSVRLDLGGAVTPPRGGA